MKKRRIPFLMRTLAKLSKEMGFTYKIDRGVGEYGHISFANGVRHFVSRTDIRVNMVGPHEIAGSKFHTDMFLKQFGYKVVPSKIFYSEYFRSQFAFHQDGLEEGVQYGNSLGFPLIVKPNNGLHGNDVHKIYSESELRKTLLKLFKIYDKVLVQKFAQGSDYRVIVYQGKLISAYRRTPLSVVGDGEKSIHQFLELMSLQALKEHRSLKFDYDAIKVVLKRQKKKLSTVPKKGEKVSLLDNANLSTGGSAQDVTSFIHPDYVKEAASAAQDLNLRLAGIDLMVEGDISKKPAKGKYFFLEVNASPGFDWYSRLGKTEHNRILDLFRSIIKDIQTKKIRP